jgi:DNA-binding transcriptional MerR regulator
MNMIDNNVIELPMGTAAPRPPRDERDWLTGPEACREAGISYRQLDYWHRAGLITDVTNRHGSGRLLVWAETEVARMVTIRELLDAGFTLQAIRQYLDELIATGVIRVGNIIIRKREIQQ